MKLRILDNSLRLRLSQAEVEQLGKGEAVIATIHFPANTKLIYRILPTPGQTEIQVQFLNNQITVAIPLQQLERWANSDAVGISASNQLQDKEQLRILIEKDFKCLTVRPDEDESGLFPNPMEGEAAC